jgi:A/G-specific adenine glycosylase
LPIVLNPARIGRLRRDILEWYAANGRDLPWRHTDDPYAILVSEVMLQQTQVARVIGKYEAFMRRFPTLGALAGASLADVLAVWTGLGYNNRAVRLRECARAVVADDPRSPSLPDTLPELEALPGIGPYTARAVLIFASNADLAAVDANVRRVLTHELRLPTDLPPAALQAVAERVLPAGGSRDWHNALMDYGALVLTARVTGIAPRSKQGLFVHSRRWYRGRLVRLLVEQSPLPLADLPELLALPAEQVERIVLALERDGLLRRAGKLVALP